MIAVASIAVVGLYRAHGPTPAFSVIPTQNSARSLTPSEVENVLGLQFQVAGRVTGAAYF